MKYIPAVALAVFICITMFVGALYVYMTPGDPPPQAADTVAEAGSTVSAFDAPEPARLPAMQE